MTLGKEILKNPNKNPNKYSTIESPRIRCNLFKSISNNAIWLKKQSTSFLTYDLPVLKSTLDDFHRHLNSGCFCTSRSASYLAMATTYLEQFYSMLRNSMKFLEEKEFQLMKSTEEAMNKRKETNYINDIDLKEESSFISQHNGNVNQSNFNKLINNLFHSLKMFEKTFEVDKKELILTSTFLDRLGTLTNLNTLFQIFLYYGMDIYAFKTVDLALVVIGTYYLIKNVENEEILVTQCNLVKFFLKMGFIETARSYYKRFFSQYKFDDIKAIDSYSHSLIFLLYCEISLRTHNGKQVALKLKDFLGGEYLKKATIKRYIIKAMAYLLASRFPSVIYQYEDYFNEFIDPIQMSVGMCRRWRMFKMFFASNVDVETLDPWWIRFTTFNIFSNSLEHFIDFHINNGMATDPVFYYKIAANLYTITLNLLSLTKLQLIGARYDISNGFLIDAKFKMILFKRFFNDNSSCNEIIFQMHQLDKGQDNCNYNESDDQDQSLVLQAKDLFINKDETDSYDFNIDENFNSVNALYKCYKRLIIEARATSNSSEDDDINYHHEDISFEDLLKNFLKDFRTVKLSEDLVLNLFHQYLFYIINMVVIEYEESKNPKKIISQDRYLFLLNFFEHFTMQVYFSTLNKLIKSSGLKNDLKTSMAEQVANGPIANLFWTWSLHFIRIMITNGLYRETLPFLTVLIDISANSYRDRIYRSQMFYYRALVLYKHLKTLSSWTEKSKRIYKLKTHHMNENVKLNLTEDKMLTPSPKKNKRFIRSKANVTKAPVKSGHVSDTVKQYGKSLLQKIQLTREKLIVVEGTRKNVCELDFEELETLNENEMDGLKIVQTEHNTQKKSQQRSIKCGTSNFNLDQQLLNQPFDIYVDCNEIQNTSSLSQLFSNLSIFEKNDENVHDTYLSKLFNVEEFQKNFDIQTISLDDIKQSLKKVVCYIGCHPSHKQYTQVQYLNYKLAKLTSKSGQILAYYLAETASYHAFRYRLLFNSFKKMNNSKTVQYDLNLMCFKNEDYVYQSYLNDLPKTWRFVQIKLIENESKFPDLLLCRFQSGYKPIFIKIKNDLQKVTKFFMEEFEEIMKMNSVSIFETEKDAFWKMRYEYDNRLKLLLDSTEKNIFGLAKGIFMGQLNDKKYMTACAWFRRRIIECAKEMNLVCQDNQLLEIIIESIVMLKSEETETAAKILFETNEPKFIAKFQEFRKKYFSTWFMNDKLEQLFKEIEPVGLIIDRALNQFPFESMPTFRQLNQPFFRVPSVRVAALLYKKYKPIIENGMDDEKTFYLLNPGNNLENTEKFFKQSFSSINEWTGFVGEVPDGKTLEHNLETKDIYLYMGHGSGSQFYRSIPNGLDIVNINSLSIVAGCSSGRVTSETKTADIFGAAYRFLLNGAPSYIGTMWDITDKDIDIFFDHFMSCWFKRWKPNGSNKMNSLCKSISMSRDSCKLKHLIGCAPVVYGLPINNCLK